jgi:hypothetical protein
MALRQLWLLPRPDWATKDNLEHGTLGLKPEHSPGNRDRPLQLARGCGKMGDTKLPGLRLSTEVEPQPLSYLCILCSAGESPPQSGAPSVRFQQTWVERGPSILNKTAKISTVPKAYPSTIIDRDQTKDLS